MKIVSITLRNFLILREAEIELHPGMNVVTGETGSGKSLFVEAIKLLMGGKGARHLAGKWGPNGEVTAVIEVEKNDAELRNRLDFFGIELEDDSRFTVRRQIGEKNASYLQGTPTPQSTVESIMEGQLEISSQFENRELFKSEYQIGVIDRFALPEQLRVSYSELYAKLTAIKKEIEYLKRQDEPSKRDYLEFQIKEIGDLGLQAGEEDTLKQKIETADNMQKIQSLVSQLEDLISSSNGALSQADRRMNDLTKIMAVGDLADRLRSLSIECADIERSFNRLTSNIDENMIDDEARERYNKLCSIFMKHGVKGSHELLAKYAEMSAELKSLFAVPDKIRDLNKEYYKTLKTAEEEAQKMQKLRLNIIPGIESKIAEYLAKFGMERAVFKIVIIKSEELGEHGFDSIKFMVNTIGSGEMFQVKNLSGGELSRLLLALKLIDNEQGRFILFDEIDSNIGGEVASRAAQELKESSKSNQIVVVTHFPQTAARGDAHFVVEKSGEDDIQSMLHQVDKAERIKELARMMGDSSSTANFEAARKLVRS